MRLQARWHFIWAGLMLLAAGTSQVSAANIGTLTCVTADETGADIKLSCTFKSTSGADGKFSGLIVRRGVPDVKSGRLVMVWSVVAQANDVDLASIAGRYQGVTGTAATGQLVGGSKGSVVLEPVAGPAQTEQLVIPTIMELQLDPVRA